MHGQGNVGTAIGDMVAASQQQGQQPEAGPPTVPMAQICGGTPSSIVWAQPPCQAGACPPAVRPQGTVRQLLDRIPMPAVTLDMSPGQSVGGIKV